MKKIMFLILSMVLSVNSHAQNSTFSQVVRKFKNDKVAFEQFKYLGELNCLDNELGLEQKKVLITGYGYLFNRLEALPRLIEYGVLVKSFNLFEKKNKINNSEQKTNKYELCSDLYNTSDAKNFYLSFISERSNFHTKDNYEFFDEEEFKQYMLDYLNMGKIDQCRVLDCIPEREKK